MDRETEYALNEEVVFMDYGYNPPRRIMAKVIGKRGNKGGVTLYQVRSTEEKTTIAPNWFSAGALRKYKSPYETRPTSMAKALKDAEKKTHKFSMGETVRVIGGGKVETIRGITSSLGNVPTYDMVSGYYYAEDQLQSISDAPVQRAAFDIGALVTIGDDKRLWMVQNVVVDPTHEPRYRLSDGNFYNESELFKHGVIEKSAEATPETVSEPVKYDSGQLVTILSTGRADRIKDAMPSVGVYSLVHTEGLFWGTDLAERVGEVSFADIEVILAGLTTDAEANADDPNAKIYKSELLKYIEHVKEQIINITCYVAEEEK